MRSIVAIMALLCAIVPITSNAFTTTGGEVGKWWDESPWADPERGFNWYPEPLQEKPKEKPQPQKKKKKSIEEMTDLDEIKKEIEHLKAVAVGNPTEKNVLEYLRAQNQMYNKAAKFADVSRRVVWANPEVDYSNRNPYASFAAAKDRERRYTDIQETLKSLSETHAILFFAKSTCPHCQDQAPVLRSFSLATKIPVLAISLDNRVLPYFPEAKPDNGISMLATGGEGIQVVPALYLIDRATKAVIPLGTGVIASSELGERISTLVKTAPGQDF